MSEPIRSIVIAGGGTSGWMAATYLQHVLSRFSPAVKITVIEPEDIPTIGVGEATVPNIRNFFKLIEIPEVELMIKADATIKSGIKFVDWNTQNDGGYYHPFEAPEFSDGLTIAEHWHALNGANSDDIAAFAMETGIVPPLCEANLLLKTTSETQYTSATSYAYHLDAIKLANHLKNLAIKRGVILHTGKIASTRLAPSGYIEAIVTADDIAIEADFFIDCTGFAGLLIEKALGDGYVNYQDELLCDRAITVQTPPREGAEHRIRSYTTATAKSSGWMWEIDLPTRSGNGYVYSSRFQSAESAKRELCEHLKLDPESTKVNELQFTSGRRQHFWLKNCLSIGLASGFLEPLESTGIQFIELALRLFFEHLPNKQIQQPLVDQYNASMREYYDETRDFIQLHYLLTQREDSEFWQHIRAMPYKGLLKDRMALWQHKLPSASDFSRYAIFGHVNYLYILSGMRGLPTVDNARTPNVNLNASKDIIQEMARIQKNALGDGIKHEDFIERMRAPFGL